jgi:hypothetical protein
MGTELTDIFGKLARDLKLRKVDTWSQTETMNQFKLPKDLINTTVLKVSSSVSHTSLMRMDSNPLEIISQPHLQFQLKSRELLTLSTLDSSNSNNLPDKTTVQEEDNIKLIY